jgi:hypothetical protein
MTLYNIIPEYFFENFKGVRGSSSRGGKKNDKDPFNRYILKILIFVAILSFLTFITILFPSIKKYIL